MSNSRCDSSSLRVPRAAVNPSVMRSSAGSATVRISMAISGGSANSLRRRRRSRRGHAAADPARRPPPARCFRRCASHHPGGSRRRCRLMGQPQLQVRIVPGPPSRLRAAAAGPWRSAGKRRVAHRAAGPRIGPDRARRPDRVVRRPLVPYGQQLPPDQRPVPDVLRAARSELGPLLYTPGVLHRASYASEPDL